MKKRGLSILLGVALTLSLAIPAMAAEAKPSALPGLLLAKAVGAQALTDNAKTYDVICREATHLSWKVTFSDVREEGEITHEEYTNTDLRTLTIPVGSTIRLERMGEVVFAMSVYDEWGENVMDLWREYYDRVELDEEGTVYELTVKQRGTYQLWLYPWSGNDGMDDFTINVVDDDAAPAPEPAPEPVPTAFASNLPITVDGAAVEFTAYALKDEAGNQTNYVKLRDLASVLNGTAAQFEVVYDGAIGMETGKPYTPNGSEMETPFAGDRAYTVNTAPIKVNGTVADLSAITLTDDAGGGFTYFKLRDVGKALGFNVSWDGEAGSIVIHTDQPYDDN